MQFPSYLRWGERTTGFSWDPNHCPLDPKTGAPPIEPHCFPQSKRDKISVVSMDLLCKLIGFYKITETKYCKDTENLLIMQFCKMQS